MRRAQDAVRANVFGSLQSSTIKNKRMMTPEIQGKFDKIFYPWIDFYSSHVSAQHLEKRKEKASALRKYPTVVAHTLRTIRLRRCCDFLTLTGRCRRTHVDVACVTRTQNIYGILRWRSELSIFLIPFATIATVYSECDDARVLSAFLSPSPFAADFPAFFFH